MFGNAKLKLIVMCNLYSIFSGISVLKSCKSKLCCSLNDRANFCTVCHMLDSGLRTRSIFMSSSSSSSAFSFLRVQVRVLRKFIKFFLVQKIK